MSISIATMGKFIPAAGGSGRVIERIVETGSSGYGIHYTRKKPTVVINQVSHKDKQKPIIKITSIEEM